MELLCRSIIYVDIISGPARPNPIGVEIEMVIPILINEGMLSLRHAAYPRNEARPRFPIDLDDIFL